MKDCKTAPTFLYRDGEKKPFMTQAEVDRAWREGWNDGKIQEEPEKPKTRKRKENSE